MARSKEYLIEVLKGYKVENVRSSSDIDELMQVVCDDHIRSGHQLSKDDIGLLRETIREMTPSESNNNTVITTASQVIAAVDPKLGAANGLITNLVDINAKIKESQVSAENIGSIAPIMACKTICDIYEKQRMEAGDPIPEDEKFDVEAFAESGFGQGLSLFGKILARNIREKMIREGRF